MAFNNMDEKEFEDEEVKPKKADEEVGDEESSPSLDELADADMGPEEEPYDDIDNL